MRTIGSIPEWIKGTLTSNGPGIQKIGPDRYKHLFDGLAILHRFHIVDGKVLTTDELSDELYWELGLEEAFKL